MISTLLISPPTILARENLHKIKTLNESKINSVSVLLNPPILLQPQKKLSLKNAKLPTMTAAYNQVLPVTINARFGLQSNVFSKEKALLKYPEINQHVVNITAEVPGLSRHGA